MSEFPKDIWETAYHIMCSVGYQDPHEFTVLVARHLLEERERCAKVADEFDTGEMGDKSALIATAIRAGASPEKS